MKDSKLESGLVPRRDTYVSKTSNSIKAYLLECKMKKILGQEADPDVYPRLHDETGIPLLKIREAVEDRVFLLDIVQLRQGLELHKQKGILALVEFLHLAKVETHGESDCDLTYQEEMFSQDSLPFEEEMFSENSLPSEEEMFSEDDDSLVLEETELYYNFNLDAYVCW